MIIFDKSIKQKYFSLKTIQRCYSNLESLTAATRLASGPEPKGIAWTSVIMCKEK